MTNIQRMADVLIHNYYADYFKWLFWYECMFHCKIPVDGFKQSTYG